MKMYVVARPGLSVSRGADPGSRGEPTEKPQCRRGDCDITERVDTHHNNVATAHGCNCCQGHQGGNTGERHGGDCRSNAPAISFLAYGRVPIPDEEAIATHCSRNHNMLRPGGVALNEQAYVVW